MENNNRQGCRWTKAGDFVPENPEMKHWRDAETKEPTLWRAIKKIAVSENNSDQVEWLSIEPCATSSDRVVIEVLDWLLEEKRLPTGIPDDFYEDKIVLIDGTYYWDSDTDGDHPMMGKDVMAIYNKLKSQTPSPTGDRDCEELKKEVERLKGLLEYELKRREWPQYKEETWQKFKTENNL